MNEMIIHKRNKASFVSRNYCAFSCPVFIKSTTYA